MKKTTILLTLVFMSILSCQEKSYPNWKKTDNGYYQKTIFPYRYDWKRVDRVTTLDDTLNGTFEVYNKNGTINHSGEFKDGKIYGNLYEFDTKERLKEYSFIYSDCGECSNLPPAHYIMIYDSIGKQKNVTGTALIEWNVNKNQVRLNDSLQLNVLLATPPNFLTELVVLDLDTKEELKVIPGPNNENEIKIGFGTIGTKRLGIHYRLIQEGNPTGMISTDEFQIRVTE